MSVSSRALGIDNLSIEDRLALVEEIWASICAEKSAFVLTAAQRAELDRRVADDVAFPDDVVPWEDVKAALLTQSSK